MNGDLVYHEVDGLVIADIKPVNVKNHRVGLRVAKFTREGKYIVTYASIKDAANALTIELKKQILNTLITLLLRLLLLKVILKLLMVINGDTLVMMVVL